jgi:ATP-dependent helicase/DNAse subunit B
VSLALLVGPANAGKVATLLDRYAAALDREPVLLVPNRGEVERIERDLLTRAPALVGGWIGTFDDLFELLVRSGADRPVLTGLQRRLVVARVVAGTELAGLGASSRYDGFVETLTETVADLEAATVRADELDGDLARLYSGYLGELERLGVTDPEGRACSAADRIGRDLDAWSGAPVFVYGFEDLTGPQWATLEALAGRTEVVVSLPYEPGRVAFAALERTATDLAELAGGEIEELPAQGWYEAPPLAHLERGLFTEARAEPPALDGAIRFLEAAGTRASLELVGEEILSLLRAGMPAQEIAVLTPSIDRLRAPLETAFGGLGVPFAVDGPIRLRRTPLGRALLGLVRFAWLEGSRRELFAFLRSPYSGMPRSRADFVEGRLRGRAVTGHERVEEETVRLLGHPVEALELLRAAPSSVAGVRELARTMLRSAWGLERAPVEEAADLDLKVAEAIGSVLQDLEGFERLGGSVTREEIVAALERGRLFVRLREPGRVVVLDLLRARTRRFRAVFVVGLEDGVLPRRSVEPPFLPDELRSELDARGGKRRRLVRADALSRDRYLFYTACTRPWAQLTLVREAATDEGRALEPSPFYEEVRSLFDPTDVERWTRRRRLSELAWEPSSAPTERERLRSVAALAAEHPTAARALAASEGWTRQIERALAAFTRPTALVNPVVLAQLRDTDRFSVTEVEQFGDCSSMWLLEKVVSPRTIDGEVDARLRGGVAHQALYRFYAGLPKRFGTDTVDSARLDEAVEFLGECLDEAIAGQVRLEVAEVDILELRAGLARDLEHFVRRDAELGLTLEPRRFEVSFGSERAAPELQRGLDLGGFTLSGKIDRIDVDPFSARGIVQDYKSGEAYSAARTESEGRLQIPLYVLALRDLVGIEPLGGLYRSLSGEREARGLLRKNSAADVPGMAERDYLDEDEFWGQVERAGERARAAVRRVREGDVRHDPRWPNGCPSWCRLWPMCRVARA